MTSPTVDFADDVTDFYPPHRINPNRPKSTNSEGPTGYEAGLWRRINERIRLVNPTHGDVDRESEPSRFRVVGHERPGNIVAFPPQKVITWSPAAEVSARADSRNDACTD
jgi:hypothetical protein